jgi:hypothetical protein
MLLRRRNPEIESRPVESTAGLEHLRSESIAVLRWLAQSRVQYIVVGDVARAIRGDSKAGGPVAIVPAPYGRNLEHLAQALASAHARMRVDRAGAELPPAKLNAEKLARGQRWAVRCGVHDLDIEGPAPGVPSYQDLVYEAGTFEPEPGLKVEVASLTDIERVEHLHRVDAEIRITRTEREPA